MRKNKKHQRWNENKLTNANRTCRKLSRSNWWHSGWHVLHSNYKQNMAHLYLHHGTTSTRFPYLAAVIHKINKPTGTKLAILQPLRTRTSSHWGPGRIRRHSFDPQTPQARCTGPPPHRRYDHDAGDKWYVRIIKCNQRLYALENYLMTRISEACST
jgi:hypothetical protein